MVPTLKLFGVALFAALLVLILIAVILNALGAFAPMVTP